MCMVVQLLGFATKESAAALACWLQWLSAMATRDTTTSYAVRLRLHAHNASKVASPDRGALWKARLAWVSSVLGRPSADAEAVLFSDLDVIPLRPYSALLDKACAPDNSPKFTNSWYGTGRPGMLSDKQSLAAAAGVSSEQRHPVHARDAGGHLREIDFWAASQVPSPPAPPHGHHR
jgi:hypothetical protein